jgi:hypothetical protein
MTSNEEQKIRLEKETGQGSMHSGGTVAYRVCLAGRWVGWIGDGREWKGWHYGGRKWWGCWREDADTAARWNTYLTHPTRGGALAALVKHISDSQRR